MKSKRFMLMVLFVIAAMCVGCKGRESEKAVLVERTKPENSAEIAVNRSEKGAEEQASFEAIQISKPIGADLVQSICYLDSGLLRIAASDQNMLNVRIWDSSDEGKTWEEAGSPTDIIGQDPVKGMTQVTLAQTGDMLILYEDYGIDLSNLPREELWSAANQKTDYLYYVNEEMKSNELEMKSGGSYIYRYSEDGQLFTNDDKSIYLMDKKTGKVREMIPYQEKEDDYLISYTISANKLFVFLGDPDGRTKMLQYNTETWEKEEVDSNVQKEVANTAETSMSLAMIGQNEDLYYIGTGLYKYRPADDMITTIVPKQQDTQLGMNGIQNGIAVNEKGDSFVVINRNMLANMDYLYLYTNSEERKEEQNQITQKIKIYSLTENNFMRHAIAIYQESHPQISVDYEVGYTSEDGIEISDAIRSLNTELIAGNGPDILILDGLPIHKFQEMGILEDVTEVIEKSSQSEKLFTNIIEACNKDKKIAVVPTTFSIPIIMGSSEFLHADTTEKLTQVMGQRNDSDIPVISANDFPIAALGMFATSTSEIFQEDGKVNKEGLKKYFECIEKIADLSLSEYSREEREKYYSLVNAIEGFPNASSGGELEVFLKFAQMDISMISIWDTLAATEAACEKRELEYTYLNSANGKSFIPGTMLGVNQISNNKEIAKEFLSSYLSYDIQKLFLNGLSINQAALENSIETSEDGEILTTYYKNMDDKEGMEVKKLTKKGVSEFIGFINKLETSVIPDRIVMQAVMQQADAFLYAGVSVEEAVNAVVKKVDIYVSE